MQITALLLLALGATTLATPIDISDASTAGANGTEHQLEKRGTYGWIAHFGDPFCHRGYAGDRPEIKTDCVNIAHVPYGNMLGINWGTFPYAFDSLNFYTEENCIDKWHVLKAPDHHNRDGAQSCLLTWNTVKSVRTSDTAPDAPN